MRESIIEAHLVKRVKELGGEVRKVAWVGRLGAPDRLVMLPSIGQGGELKDGRWVYFDKVPTTVWVELKATGVKAEAHQLREHERMRKMGQRVEVIDSILDVDLLLA